MRGQWLRQEVSDVEVWNQVPSSGVAGAAHRSTRTLYVAPSMTPNLFFGRNTLSDEVAASAESVERRMLATESGLHVIFEEAPVHWPKVQHIPFYVARHDYNRAGPDSGTPNEVIRHLSRPGWDHLIWVPSEIAHGNSCQFTIRYAHELQHYRQVRDPQCVREAKTFLTYLRNSGYVATLKVERDPREFDADLSALIVFREIHGDLRLMEHVAEESRNPTMANYWDRLRELERRWGEFKCRDV